MLSPRLCAHLCALGTTVVWGMTVISTKVLLEDYTPLEIALYRFILAVAVMHVLWPRRFRHGGGWRTELLFLGAGLLIGFGISIVYSITQSIIVAHSPPRRYGVTMSTYSAFDDLGSGIGPSILGLLITSVGFRDMYLFSAGVACLSLLMYWVIHGRREGWTPGCEIRPDTD